MIDIITIIPLCIPTTNNESARIFENITIILRSLRITRIVNKFFKIGETEVSKQIFKIILTILTLIFVTSGVLEAFENPVRRDAYAAQLRYIAGIYLVSIAY